jgi:hypothetical protein
MLWLGLTTFKEPMTPQHGFIYMGDSLKAPGPALHVLKEPVRYWKKY